MIPQGAEVSENEEIPYSTTAFPVNTMQVGTPVILKFPTQFTSADIHPSVF